MTEPARANARSALGPQASLLRAQVAAIWPKESAVLLNNGLPRTGHVLEVGCGPGFVTRMLRKLVPDCHISAVDHDPIYASLVAKESADDPNVTVTVASADALPFRSGFFDGALLRLVLQHVPDPLAVLREVRRVLRPNGVVLVVDVDHDASAVTDPPLPHDTSLRNGLLRWQRASGGNRRVGRHLPSLLTTAGFADVSIDAVAAHSAVDDRAALVEVIAVVEHLLPAMVNAEMQPWQAEEVVRFFADVRCGRHALEILLVLLVASGRVGGNSAARWSSTPI
jgi:SAM-dependent methyltransferase